MIAGPGICFGVFAAFQFDPEAAKDIDERRWPGVMLLKAQMNADLLTEDLTMSNRRRPPVTLRP
jgi:adenine-specific DNA-methyltransferase